VTFLSPWTALVAAAVALPLLLLLYFLKLRRQTLRIPSTLLWKKSFEDLQVNAPFQRLRWSTLLILQLLMLLALLAALAEPLWRGGEARSSRVVIVIDRSASMNAPVLDELPQEDGRPQRTRLDAARQAAIDIIDSLGARSDGRNGTSGGSSQAMIIAFGSTAQVVSTFESNRGVLRDAVNSIQPTDEEANLEGALQLAGAFAGSRDEASVAGGAGEAPPEVVLLSDGGATGADETLSLRAGDFRFVQVANGSDAPEPLPIDNLGIVALGARRDYEDPARVMVFARLLNASAKAIDAVITLALDGRPATTIRRNVPPASAEAPGEATLSHALDLPGGAVITLQHNHADQLTADDVAALVLPPPARPRMALVFGSHGDDSAATGIPPGPDPYLHELLAATEPQTLDIFTGDAWNQIDPATVDSGSRYDLVVFDRVTGHRLPGVPSLTFGGAPAGAREIEPAGNGHAGQAILSWDRQHPVLRNLALDSIVYTGFGALDLPQSIATPLAYGPDGPIIALLRTRGARHLVVGFALRRSNWPLHVSSAMFVQNAIEFLSLSASGATTGAADGGAGGGLVHRPGESTSVRTAPDARSIVIEGAGINLSVPVEPGAPVNLPAFRRAGVYRVSGAAPPNSIVAVSVLSDVESDIRPRDSITVNAEAAEALTAKTQQPMPLWPWLLGAALGLAVIEWIVYCRRVA
jgi:hypothetical protein